jgi:hypothetical protein
LHTCFVEYSECDYNLGRRFVVNYFHNISFGLGFFLLWLVMSTSLRVGVEKLRC